MALLKERFSEQLPPARHTAIPATAQQHPTAKPSTRPKTTSGRRASDGGRGTGWGKCVIVSWTLKFFHIVSLRFDKIFLPNPYARRRLPEHITTRVATYGTRVRLSSLRLKIVFSCFLRTSFSASKNFYNKNHTHTQHQGHSTATRLDCKRFQEKAYSA